MPGARAPMVDGEGRIDPTWLKFLTDMYERTGGGSTDKVETGATGAESAQASADAAQASADQAQAIADDIDRRIDFDFDFDLR